MISPLRDIIRFAQKGFRYRKPDGKLLFLDAVKKVFTDSFYRALIYKRLFESHTIHQTSNWTAMDRYPAIFKASRDYFENSEANALKILSFGCSTGEEVFTLRRYFSSAHILGVDIIEKNLEAAREKNTDERIHFAYSDPETLRTLGPFDAIFCMSVLQRSELNRGDVASSKKIYSFHKYDEQIKQLDAVLAPKGLLVIYSANYRFCDARVASTYEVIKMDPPEFDETPKFDANSMRIEGKPYTDVIFAKVNA